MFSPAYTSCNIQMFEPRLLGKSRMFLKKVPNQFHFIICQQPFTPLQHLRMNPPSSQGFQDLPFERRRFDRNQLFTRSRRNGQFLQNSLGQSVFTGQLQAANS